MRNAQRIAWLCQQAADGELEQLAAEAGAGPLLTLILTVARSGSAEIPEQDLDALDHAFTRIGIDGLTVPDGDRTYRPLAGTSGHPVVYAWTCPRQICDRVEVEDGPASEPPSCALLNLPLQRRRLPT